MVETTAKRNSSLQGAYLIMAARALGLDCGPMSGFDHAKVDEEFFAAGKPCFGCDQEFFPEGHVKTNFLCNLGYGDPSVAAPATSASAVQRGVFASVEVSQRHSRPAVPKGNTGTRAGRGLAWQDQYKQEWNHE